VIDETVRVSGVLEDAMRDKSLVIDRRRVSDPVCRGAWFRIMGIIDTTLILQITISLK